MIIYLIKPFLSSSWKWWWWWLAVSFFFSLSAFFLYFVFCPMRLSSTVMWTFGEIEMILFLFYFFFPLSGVISQKVEQMRSKSGPETDVPPGVQNVSNFFACRDRPKSVLYCSRYHWLPDGRGRGKVAGHFEHYSYCRNTWAATGWQAEDVSERQVWREGWELCFVLSAIKYSGGVGRTPAEGNEM